MPQKSFPQRGDDPVERDVLRLRGTLRQRNGLLRLLPRQPHPAEIGGRERLLVSGDIVEARRAAALRSLQRHVCVVASQERDVVSLVGRDLQPAGRGAVHRPLGVVEPIEREVVRRQPGIRKDVVRIEGDALPALLDRGFVLAEHWIDHVRQEYVGVGFTRVGAAPRARTWLAPTRYLRCRAGGRTPSGRTVPRR